MKILHISTRDAGGAGIAALRLHNSLLLEGKDSIFLSLIQNNDNNPSKHTFAQKPQKYSIFDRIKLKFDLPISYKQKNDLMLKDKPKDYEWFSFPTTDYDIENSELLNSADIIHLHWVADFINYENFFNVVKKPIVWTLHDMNPFLGGFHYLNDKENFKDFFSDLEEELVRIKKKSINVKQNITIVTPSKWLGNCSKESPTFKSYPHYVIPYGIDVNIFRPFDKSFAKNVFSLPANKKIILFVSENIESRRKGFDLLVDAIKEVNLGINYIIATIGNTHSQIKKDEKIYHIGKIKDERLMSLLYAAADIFILPSREDNFPNVMLESLACGTPVIAFDVGGMKDVIVDGYNGLLIKDIHSSSLAQGIQNFIDGNIVFDNIKIRNFALEHFKPSIQANSYSKIYEKLL